MRTSNRGWLPPYCQPDRFLPCLQEARDLFARPPYLFADFVGRAYSFLAGEEAPKTGFEFSPETAIPCHWKCADESLFGVELSLFAATGLYPFGKGLIGGYFNESSLAPAVHHGPINIDFGGSHVGYRPGEGGGSFGEIWRPQQKGYAFDCGHLMGLIQPFQALYNDACQRILLFRPPGEEVVISVPNEFLQPAWSSERIKLLVEIETLTNGQVEQETARFQGHTPLAHSLFYAHPGFLEGLSPQEADRYSSPTPAPVGLNLSPSYFHLFDAQAELDNQGLPLRGLLAYMKYIVAAKETPPALTISLVNTSLEHGRLRQAVSAEAFLPYAFASFSGVFIDLFDEEAGNYLNLFVPLALSLKPQGRTDLIEMGPQEIRRHLDRLTPAPPQASLKEVLGLEAPERVLSLFTYQPGN